MGTSLSSYLTLGHGKMLRLPQKFRIQRPIKKEIKKKPTKNYPVSLENIATVLRSPCIQRQCHRSHQNERWLREAAVERWTGLLERKTCLWVLALNSYCEGPWVSLDLSWVTHSLPELRFYHLWTEGSNAFLTEALKELHSRVEKCFVIYGRDREHWFNSLDSHTRETWLARGYSLYNKYGCVMCQYIEELEKVHARWMNEWMNEALKCLTASIPNIIESRGSDWLFNSSKSPKWSSRHWCPAPPHQHSVFLRNLWLMP